MKNPAVRDAAALKGRHRDFFKRLDKFLKNYAHGVCGLEMAECPVRVDRVTRVNAKP